MIKSLRVQVRAATPASLKMRAEVTLGMMIVVFGSLSAQSAAAERPEPPVAVFEQKGSRGVKSMILLPSRGLLAVATQNGLIRLFDPAVEKPAVDLNAKAGAAWCLVSDPKEQWLAAAYAKG